MRPIHLLVAACLISGAASARADIFRYFTVSGTLASGGAVDGTVGGTLTYSSSNVFRTSFAFTANVNGASKMYDLPLTNVIYTPDRSIPLLTSLLFDTNKGFAGNFDEIALLTAGDFGSGALCTLDSPCDAAGDSSYFYSFDGRAGERSDFVSGSLTDGTSAAGTPEPSTFVLLATGLLSVGHIVRRRSKLATTIERKRALL